jgi:hypothetical protein
MLSKHCLSSYNFQKHQIYVPNPLNEQVSGHWIQHRNPQMISL